MNIICKTCNVSKTLDNFINKNGKKCFECKKIYNRKKAKKNYQDNEDRRNNYLKNIDNTTTKLCSKCNILKTLNHFDFRRKQCKKCRKEIKKQCNKKYYEKNKEKIIKRVIKYEINKKNTDMAFRLMKNLKKRTRDCFKSSVFRKDKLLSCNKIFFQEWINFNLSYENYNLNDYNKKWHLDHVIPLKWFFDNKLINENSDFENIHKSQCCHWSNIYPLDSKKNILKSDKIDNPSILKQDLRLYIFLQSKGMKTVYKQTGVFNTIHIRKLL